LRRLHWLLARGRIRLSRAFFLAGRNYFEQFVRERTLELKRLLDRRGSPLLRFNGAQARSIGSCPSPN
jgi:hypothetical protein